MTIIDAVKILRASGRKVKDLAVECGYHKEHFCVLLNQVERGERIPARAKTLILLLAKNYA